MRKFTLMSLLFASSMAVAQTNSTNPKDTARKTVDSTLVNDVKESMLDNIPTVSLDDNDMGDGGSQNISSVLTAGRDPFILQPLSISVLFAFVSVVMMLILTLLS
jgi:hypothetical protein